MLFDGIVLSFIIDSIERTFQLFRISLLDIFAPCHRNSMYCTVLNWYHTTRHRNLRVFHILSQISGTEIIFHISTIELKKRKSVEEPLVTEAKDIIWAKKSLEI